MRCWVSGVAYCLLLGAEIKRNKRDGRSQACLPHNHRQAGRAANRPSTRCSTTAARRQPPPALAPCPPGTRPAPGESVGRVRSRYLAQTGHPLGRLLARAGPRPKAWSTRHRIGGIPRSQLDEPPGKCYAATPSRQLRKLVPLAQIQQPVIEPAGPSGWTVPSLPHACRRLTLATLPCAGGGRRDVSSSLGTVLGT